MNLLLQIVLSVIGCFLLLIVASILLIIVSSFFVSEKKTYRKNSRYCRFLINLGAFGALFFTRTKVHVKGLGNIPKDSRFVLACNHLSKFDPIITWFILKRFDIACISKPENFKVPFFGKLIRACLFQPIDRENPKNAMKTLEECSLLMKNDQVSFLMYPEGTRNTTEQVLQPFHSFMFRLPVMADVPLVIMTIRNTKDIARRFPRGGSHIYIDFVCTIPREEVADTRPVDLSTKAYDLIYTGLLGERV